MTMNPTDLKEVIQKYLSEIDNIQKKEEEIELAEKSLPEVSLPKNQIYTIDEANQLFQNALKKDEYKKALQGLKDDHEATRVNVENLLKKIPNIKVSIGNSYYLIFESDEGKLREGNDTLSLNM